eukprot:gene6973-4937_t
MYLFMYVLSIIVSITFKKMSVININNILLFVYREQQLTGTRFRNYQIVIPHHFEKAYNHFFPVSPLMRRKKPKSTSNSIK